MLLSDFCQCNGKHKIRISNTVTIYTHTFKPGACALSPLSLCLSFPILSLVLSPVRCTCMGNAHSFRIECLSFSLFLNISPYFEKLFSPSVFAHCKIYPILRQSCLFSRWQCIGLGIVLFCFLMFSTSIFNFQLLICQKILFHVVIRTYFPHRSTDYYFLLYILKLFL